MSDDGTIFRLTGNTGKPLPHPKPIKHHRANHGYGLAHLSNGKSVKAFLSHRIIWETLRGAIPAGMEVNHINGDRYDNRLVNLEIVTRSQNMLHKFRTLGRVSKTKPKYGPEHHNNKFSKEQVVEMRRLWASGVTQVEIASRFNAHQTTVSDIVRVKSRING